MKIRFLCFCILIFILRGGIAAELKAMQIQPQGEKLSIFFSIQGKTTPKLFHLSSPERLVIDFPQTQSALRFVLPETSQRWIKQIRTHQSKDKSLRLVFDLQKPVQSQLTRWRPAAKQLEGLRIELSYPQALAKKRVKTSNYTPQKLRDVVVVIDPGHGGKDPGASGPRGSQEKQVVLAISLKLKQLIDKEEGMRAILTRHNDYYIGLRQRLDIARKQNADIFVAVHADAFINQQSNGASVFSLSANGATSEAARWLAEKENYSELGGVNLSDLDDKNGIVRSVLIDLSQTATIRASLDMGQHILQQLDKITKLHNNRVEQAQFVVLKSPDIPSVLIETGFISNPREEKNLTNPQYQARLSQAIFQGIKQYFWDYPPHNTVLENKVNMKRSRLAHAQPKN